MESQKKTTYWTKKMKLIQNIKLKSGTLLMIETMVAILTVMEMIKESKLTQEW